MEQSKQKMLECFEMGDLFYNKCVQEYRQLRNRKQMMEKRDVVNFANYIGTNIGLACEYYLKGLILPYIKIVLTKETEDLKDVVNALTEEEKYQILLGDDDVITKISQRYKVSKKSLAILQKYSLKKFGHHLNNIIEMFDPSNIDELDIPLEIKNILFAEIKNYYFHFFGFTSSTSVEGLSNNLIVELLGKKEISDSFVEGRYAHLSDDYISDVEKLINLLHAIRFSIIRYYNANSITTGKGIIGDLYATDQRLVFPDADSKVYIFDNGEQLSRVYVLKNFSQYIDELYAQRLSKKYKTSYQEVYDKLSQEGNEGLENELVICCPEYGRDQMLKISQDIPETLPSPNHKVLGYRGQICVEQNNCFVIIQQDYQYVSYFISNGKIMKGNQRLTDTLVQHVQYYENNINNKSISKEIEYTHGLFYIESLDEQERYISFLRSCQMLLKMERENSTSGWEKKIIRKLERDIRCELCCAILAKSKFLISKTLNKQKRK